MFARLYFAQEKGKLCLRELLSKLFIYCNEIFVFLAIYIEMKNLRQCSEGPGGSMGYLTIRVITKLPNYEQSYKGKVKTHNYINRQNQSTTGKL